jgi:uncharacterized protein (DUF169 family)
VQNDAIATSLTSLLGLERQPIALGFASSPPADVAAAPAAGPSSCSFWTMADQGMFYASAAEHFNCPVGAMVMGFGLPPEVGEQLQGLVKTMCENNYLSPDEAAEIPTVQRQSAGIVYGPLAQFTTTPDLVLLWVSPEQAMLFNEATGNAAWTSSLMEVSGRPGCAALALADREQSGRLSLGCAGMRTFTGIEPGLLLATFPGGKAAELAESLQAARASNDVMESFYQNMANQFS